MIFHALSQIVVTREHEKLYAQFSTRPAICECDECQACMPEFLQSFMHVHDILNLDSVARCVKEHFPTSRLQTIAAKEVLRAFYLHMLHLRMHPEDMYSCKFLFFLVPMMRVIGESRICAKQKAFWHSLAADVDKEKQERLHVVERVLSML
jgi:hypothetical protein